MNARWGVRRRRGFMQVGSWGSSIPENLQSLQAPAPCSSYGLSPCVMTMPCAGSAKDLYTCTTFRGRVRLWPACTTSLLAPLPEGMQISVCGYRQLSMFSQKLTFRITPGISLLLPLADCSCWHLPATFAALRWLSAPATSREMQLRCVKDAH
jgi:hypothetical protein